MAYVLFVSNSLADRLTHAREPIMLVRTARPLGIQSHITPTSAPHGRVVLVETNAFNRNRPTAHVAELTTVLCILSIDYCIDLCI